MSLVFPHTFVPWFRAVAPYIHAYRGKTFVVGLAGEAIAAGKLNTFVQDLSILHAMGTVSYTHLDVYKRQPQQARRVGFRSRVTGSTFDSRLREQR